MPYPSKWLLLTIAMIFIGLNATAALYFQPISDEQSALRHSRTVTTIQGTNYQFLHTLLPDGRLLANAVSRHGYKDIGPSTYQCDKTALDVRKLRVDIKE